MTTKKIAPLPRSRPAAATKPTQPAKRKGATNADVRAAIASKTILKKPVRESKAFAVPLQSGKAQPTQQGQTFDQRAKNVKTGNAKHVERKPHDPFALPALGDLPDLPVISSLGDSEFMDPIEAAASDLRVFGPDADESPIEDHEHLSHEDAETAKLAELHKGFRERMKAESARRELATDTEFWLCVVFQDRNQKDQFLENAGWLSLGDKYLDGERLAQLIGVDVDKSFITYNIGGADPKLAALTGIDDTFAANTTPRRKRRPDK